VIGLLGCALGYLRRDPRLEELDKALRFGVRVESAGRVRSDYQTVTGFLPKADGGFRFKGGTSARPFNEASPELYGELEPATIVSPRFYLEDAAFLAGFEERDGFSGLLEQCAIALAEPKWPVYLGRRSCPPSRPVYDSGRDGLRKEYEGLEDALTRHPWSWLRSGACQRGAGDVPPTLAIYIEDERGGLIRQDAIRVNAARIYDYRHARRFQVEPRVKENDS
jgi:CRISPR system Cascade subunit CasD